MIVGFIRWESTNHSRLNNNPKVSTIFPNVGWVKVCNKFSGYNDQISLEFAQNVEPLNKQGKYTHDINELKFHAHVNVLKSLVTKDLISEIKKISRSQPWDKDDRILNNSERASFFRFYEEYEEKNNDIKRKSLLDEWGEVAYNLMKHITCEGMLSIVYAYHFKMYYKFELSKAKTVHLYPPFPPIITKRYDN